MELRRWTSTDGSTKMANTYTVGTSRLVELAEVQMRYIEQCWNEWGYLDDTQVDLSSFLEEFCIDSKMYEAMKDSYHDAVRKSLEESGIILFEEHRDKDYGGDLYSIVPEYEYLFPEA